MSDHEIIERTTYPAGVPCMVDVEHVDPQAAAEFYGAVFGWTFQNMLPPGIDDQYLVASLHGLTVAAIASPTPGLAATPTWNTYVSVADADATVAQAAALGATVAMEPVDVGPPGSVAGRWAALVDPAGAAIRVWQPGYRHGVQLVNAPDSWSSSDLNTNDLDGAQRFYKSLFGWKASKVEFGGGEPDGDSYMWRLPGYGDFLAERDPDIKQRHSQPWVPEGFSDAVGWMAVMPRGAAESQAHWSVTFSVDDIDAVVGRAVDHGGTVVSPVESLGGGIVHRAVLEDPQGARFSVGSYDPAAVTDTGC